MSPDDPEEVLRVGVAGLGMAGGGILTSLARLPGVEVVAAADPRPQAQALFREQFHGRSYAALDGLCDDEEVEAIWIATPSHLHAEHMEFAAERGKHVVVEKPFAVTLEECQQMIDAAERHHVALIAGGARSFDPAFVAMRDIIVSGRLGSLGALNTWSFTGWMTRPREPYELDVDNGGGAVFNQAPHPIDVLRLLGGGMVKSVRGATAEWMTERPCPGYFTGFLEFEDGTPATLSYNGYGYIQGWELLPWGETEPRQRSLDAAYEYRRSLRAVTADEYQARETLRYAGRRVDNVSAGDGSWTPSDAGLVVVSCELGEIRQSATGLYVYDDDGRHDEPLSRGGGLRLNEVSDLRNAISGAGGVVHDGRWGMATMEVVLALMESSREHKEVTLQHQVGTERG